MQKPTKRDQSEINHVQISMDKLDYALHQSKQAAMVRVADNITRPPFGGLHKILTSSTFLKNLAVMLEAFCEVSGST